MSELRNTSDGLTPKSSSSTPSVRASYVNDAEMFKSGAESWRLEATALTHALLGTDTGTTFLLSRSSSNTTNLDTASWFERGTFWLSEVETLKAIWESDEVKAEVAQIEFWKNEVTKWKSKVDELNAEIAKREAELSKQQAAQRSRFLRFIQESNRLRVHSPLGYSATKSLFDFSADTSESAYQGSQAMQRIKAGLNQITENSTAKSLFGLTHWKEEAEKWQTEFNSLKWILRPSGVAFKDEKSGQEQD